MYVFTENYDFSTYIVKVSVAEKNEKSEIETLFCVVDMQKCRVLYQHNIIWVIQFIDYPIELMICIYREL